MTAPPARTAAGVGLPCTRAPHHAGPVGLTGGNQTTDNRGVFPPALKETGPPPAAPEAEHPSAQVIAFPGEALRPQQTPFATSVEELEQLGLDVRTLHERYAVVYAELCRLAPTAAMRKNIPAIAAAVDLSFAALSQLTDALLDSPAVLPVREK